MLNTKLLGGTASAPAVYVDDVFSTYLYTGTGATQTITNGIDLSTKGGMVWIKTRSNSSSHYLFDTTRGTGKYISSNTMSAQATDNETLNLFNTNGFRLGADSNGRGTNISGRTQCSWTFREQAKFFDVVTYTGNGVNGRSIDHNLGSVPGMMIIRQTDAINDWAVYHRSVGNTKFLVLNTDAAPATRSAVWNNTTPTSTTFRVGNDAQVNGSGQAYVAYLFAHDAGGFGTAGTDNVISCGSFTYSAETTVDLGFEPQFILHKSSSSTSDWFITDVQRSWTTDGKATWLLGNSSSAESALDDLGIAPTSTGFRVPTGFGTGATFIYMAIRRPMKPPTSGTQVFSPVSRAGNGTANTVIPTGFVTDLSIIKNKDSGWQYNWSDRLRGAFYLNSASTAAEASFAIAFDEQDGIELVSANNSNNASGQFYANWFFRRASGFFDVVCYTGTGSARTVTHNLTVIPELMIVKRRNDADSWRVYSSTLTATSFINLNTDAAVGTASSIWNNTTPTASVFSLGTSTSVNGSGGTYVAYLFASVAGVSKVGSYTGNGSSQTINCGFTAGARFVLIKRTDSTGDWVTLDTARGIVSGNDPFLQLNSAAAEVTGEDIVDPANSGFIVNSTTENINANGASYIFLAIS